MTLRFFILTDIATAGFLIMTKTEEMQNKLIDDPWPTKIVTLFTVGQWSFFNEIAEKKMTLQIKH